MNAWNGRFARELTTDSPFGAREVLAGKDGRSLARELLVASQEEFSPAVTRSPMKRAKLRDLKPNAAVVLSDVGTAEDAVVLTAALANEDPVVRVRSRRLTPAPEATDSRSSPM